MTKKFNILINQITQKLIPVCGTHEAAYAECRWLLEAATKKNMANLLTNDLFELSNAEQKTLDIFLEQRILEQKPLQYILGSVPFCNLEILVTPPILIPRPETEEWCTWLIKELRPLKQTTFTVLDICCGSGCIALALAKEYPQAIVIASDINPEALALTEKNKVKNALNNIILEHSDLYQSLTKYHGKIDIIVSNPPYIAPEEFAFLNPQVSMWEDKNALIAEEHGLGLIKHIICGASTFLRAESIMKQLNIPRLVIEHGKEQNLALHNFLTQAGFKLTQSHKDLEGIARWITAHLP